MVRVLNGVVFACAFLAGCDTIFGLTDVPLKADAVATNGLGCASRTALLCADFEEGSTYYANGIASDLPMPTAGVTTAIEAPGASGGNALYIDSVTGTYRFDAQSTTAASKITATFELEPTQFDTTTPSTSLAVLYFDQIQAPECYVALDFQPTPMRLAFVENCGSQDAPDLVIPLPSRAAFVSVTLEADLGLGTASAHLGVNSANVTLDPGSFTGLPGVAFGFIDPLVGTGARIGLDDILVVTAP